MTTTSTHTSAHRGPEDATPRGPRRILVVDQADLAEAVRRALRPQNGAAVIDVVPSYLAVLGELAHGAADVVIGPIVERDGMLAAVAAALRQLAPQARLLVGVRPGEDAEAAEALQHGAADCFELPPDAEELARLVGLASPAPAPTQPSPPRVESADEPLGDVDLVDAVLAGQGVQETALQLVADRSGLHDLELASDASAIPAEHHQAQVRRAGVSHGCLHCPAQPGGDGLDAWAGWLAHWLALDRHVRQLKQLAMTDELTSVWNRRYFDQFLRRILDHAAEDRSQVTLMVFDIDDFKLYNDRFGHAAGDEILRETARLMKSVVREHDVVARIGGDEFAVIFWDAEPPRRPNQKADSRHPQDVLQAAKRFQSAICSHHFPKLLDTAPGTLTISGGLASFPWDGRTPAELLDRADAMAMRSKQQGKNAITLGPGAMRRCNAKHDQA